MPRKPPQITAFDFKPGRTLARKYAVVSKLGQGWEGEVYLLREQATGIERAAKFFFPHRNLRNKSINFYAKKLHKLRGCPALIQYHTQETIQHQGQDISFLISDYVEGAILLDFLKAQPGKKLDAFQGLHLLHALTCAMEDVHRHRDYHGDLHPGNVIIRRHGLGFQVKLLDFFHWGEYATQENIRDDIVDVIKIFYDAIGGKARYAAQPEAVKGIVLGLKKRLILKKFKSTTQLRTHLENLNWHDL
jgi:hypothetical protein